MGTGRVPARHERITTIYLSDPQLQHLGAVPFTRNPLLRRFTDVADRNLTATQTADVFIDESLHRLKEEFQGGPLSLCILGDVADTPTVSEFSRFEDILKRHGLPVAVYARGNHSSANAFGVINLGSRFYGRLRRLPLLRHFSLRREIELTAGGPENVLTARRTFEGMHRILHEDDPHGPPGIDAISVDVVRADYDCYKLAGSLDLVGFEGPFSKRNFGVFWHPTRRARPGWECLVNARIADVKVADRPHDVTPFYIQASEKGRLKLRDGSQVPIYALSLDGLDNTHFFATRPALSELQIRVVELFIKRMLEDNPRAKFILNCHFSVRDLLRRPLLFWQERASRQAFARLLAREEVILFPCGHAHERAKIDLNQLFHLGRESPRAELTEIDVPSLIDYQPTSRKAPNEPPDARAVVVEEIYLEEDESGSARLKIDLQYKGLDRREIVGGYTNEVHQVQKRYRAKHGYISAQDTTKDLSRKHLIGWIHNHFKRLWEIATIGLNPFQVRRALDCWGQLSLATYLIDNFTVASTVNMFNEAYHLIPFLESIIYFIELEDDPVEMALRSRIDGLRTCLLEEYTRRRFDFESALARGERPVVLREYNDLFERTRAHELARLLVELRAGGQARAFVLRSGIAASKEEFKYHKKRPSDVPKVLPPIEIPL